MRLTGLAVSIAVGSAGLSAQVSNVDWASQVYPIFSEAGCLGCHGGNGGLTIGSPASTAYNNIVNGSPGNCEMTYIVPGNLQSSFLYEKISGTPSCGDRMPQDNPGYFDSNADKLELIRVWILEGALQETSTVAISAEGSELPVAFALAQNFPNPFNPATIITYRLPEAAHVTVTVYNLLGRPVVTLADELQRPGIYSVDWRGRDERGRAVPSGLYLYRMEAGAFSDLRKMVYLK